MGTGSLRDVAWRTSSYSMRNPIRGCVEVGVSPGSLTVLLRDSKNPGAVSLRLGRTELLALLRTVSSL
ncbi:DUF397 domain-containing protein [Haloactinospora alba]